MLSSVCMFTTSASCPVVEVGDCDVVLARVVRALDEVTGSPPMAACRVAPHDWRVRGGNADSVRKFNSQTS